MIIKVIANVVGAGDTGVRYQSCQEDSHCTAWGARWDGGQVHAGGGGIAWGRRMRCILHCSNPWMRVFLESCSQRGMRMPGGKLYHCVVLVNLGENKVGWRENEWD